MRGDLKDVLNGILENQQKRVLHPSLQKLLEDLIEKGICDDTIKKAAFDATKETFNITDEYLKKILEKGINGDEKCSCPACSLKSKYNSNPALIACKDGIAFLDFGGDEGAISVEALACVVLKTDHSLKDLKNPRKVLEILRGLQDG